MAKKSKKIDVEVYNDGSTFVFRPQTEAAKDWVKENVSLEEYQKWAGDSFVMEHRFAEQLADGMREAGLVLA
jgi:virulence-associated protein VagC